MCGISDVADGYLARRYKWETRFGEQLDSFSDAVFHIVILYLLIVYTDIFDAQWAILGIVIVTIFRITNLIITRAKFKTWGMLHTWGNKATGIFLYLYLPVIFISDTIPFIPGLGICSIALVSSIEEMLMLLVSKQYNANLKSFFVR